MFARQVHENMCTVYASEGNVYIERCRYLAKVLSRIVAQSLLDIAWIAMKIAKIVYNNGQLVSQLVSDKVVL